MCYRYKRVDHLNNYNLFLKANNIESYDDVEQLDLLQFRGSVCLVLVVELSILTVFYALVSVADFLSFNVFLDILDPRTILK